MGNWSEEDADPSPGSVVTESLSTLIPQKLKGTNGCPFAAQPERSKWPQLGTSPRKLVAYAVSSTETVPGAAGERPPTGTTTLSNLPRASIVSQNSPSVKEVTGFGKWTAGTGA